MGKTRDFSVRATRSSHGNGSDEKSTFFLAVRRLRSNEKRPCAPIESRTVYYFYVRASALLIRTDAPVTRKSTMNLEESNDPIA